MKEPIIEKAVREFLYKDGFGKRKKVRVEDCVKKLHTSGVDIKEKKLRPNPIGWYYLVECKGDPGRKVKSSGGSRSSSLNSALGQIISRMHTDRRALHGGYNYGVAFPISFKNIALKKIPYYVCNRLRLSIFLVNHNSEVEKYDHRRLKKIQQKI